MKQKSVFSNYLAKVILPCLLFSATSFADKIKLLDNNTDALQARVDLIQNAKHEILVEYFEVASDALSRTGLALLKEAAHRGVKVKILIDNMHNTLTYPEMAAMLGVDQDPETAKNIEIRVFNPLQYINVLHLTYRNHDKLMTIDGETDDAIMIVGGRNVAENYFGKSKKYNFKDADALVSGNSAKVSRKYFMDLWEKNPEVKAVQLYDYSRLSLEKACYGEDSSCDKVAAARQATAKAHESLASYLDVFNKGAAWVKSQPISEMLNSLEEVETIRFAFNDPTKTMSKVEVKLSTQIMDSLLLRAKESILIVTPYLFPTEAELVQLEAIAASGVKIKIVTNSLASTDVVLVHAAFLTIKKRLADMGAEIYLYKGPDILHCKGAIIDNKISMIGSFNFDRRSAQINREIGIRVGEVNSDASVFTKNFAKFIEDEILANSVLAVSQKTELATPELDALASDAKKALLLIEKGRVPFFADQI